MLGLSSDEIIGTIGKAVLTQYRIMTDGQTPFNNKYRAYA